MVTSEFDKTGIKIPPYLSNLCIFEKNGSCTNDEVWFGRGCMLFNVIIILMSVKEYLQSYF